MANVGNTCFLSNSIYLAGLLLEYSKTWSLYSTYDLHSHVDSNTCLESVTVMLGWNQHIRWTNSKMLQEPLKWSFSQTLVEVIMHSLSIRSQCHPVVPGREEPYHILPLTSNQCLWDFATSENSECKQCSQQDSQSLRIAHNLKDIIFALSVDISDWQFGPLMSDPNDTIAVDGNELVGFMLRGAITNVVSSISRPGHYVT